MVAPSPVLLIPTSKYVDPEMRLEVGKIPPALIQIDGIPLYEMIWRRYSETIPNLKCILAVNEGLELFDEFTERSRERGVPVGYVEVPEKSDLAEVITYSLDTIPNGQVSQLILNFGDTLVNIELPEAEDCIVYDKLKESYRWTTFTANGSRIYDITDKYISDSAGERTVFAGAFVIQDSGAFRRCMATAQSNRDVSAFYSGIMNYYRSREYQLIPALKWFDFGHPDNYHQAKKSFVNKRYFNQVEIDERRAIATKRSTNHDKLRAEIRWYSEMPSGLRCYLPQIYDFSSFGERPFIKMEYYGYPALSELLLSSGHDLGIWSHAFENVFAMLHEFSAYSLGIQPKQIRETLRSMYLGKTVERIGELKDHPIFSKFLENELSINGVKYPSLNSIIPILENNLGTTLDLTWSALTVIHGDLCASNILFDPRSRVVKVLDPRGCFGEEVIYGDARYDLAKLRHSFCGYYDLIIAGRFFSIVDDLKITTTINEGPYQSRVRELFEEHLKTYGRSKRLDLQSIELIEALLFISMVPLHADRLDRQIAMLGNGIKKFWDIVERL